MSHSEWRSFTDPLSNVMQVAALSSQEKIINYIRNKFFDSQASPVFLHELTHHWCFDSPLGCALSLVYYAVTYESMLANEGKLSGGINGIMANFKAIEMGVNQFESCLGIMNSLAEGIALFAEHDAYPSFTDTISTPMLFGGMLFAPHEVASELGFNYMKHFLLQQRLSAQHIRRKVDLLMTGLTGRDGTYLAGYLTIKSFWHYARSVSVNFGDGDFFLSFIRHLFYDDWELVNALLSYDINLFVEHFFNRFPPLFNPEKLTSSATAVLDRLEASEKDKFTYHGDLYKMRIELSYIPILPSGSIAEGQNRFKQFVETLFDVDPGSLDSSSAFLHTLNLQGLMSHGVVTVSRAKFKAKVTQKHIELYTNDDVLAFTEPLLKDFVDDWIGEADVSILAVPSKAIDLFLMIIVEQQVVSYRSIHGKEAELNLSIWDEAGFRLETAKIRRQYAEDALGGKLSSNPDFSSTILKLYSPMLFPYLDNSISVEATIAAMAKDGIYGLLDHNLPLLFDAAVASLAATYHIHLDRLDNMHAWSQGNARQSIHVLNTQLQPWFGIEPFSVLNEIDTLSLSIL